MKEGRAEKRSAFRRMHPDSLLVTHLHDLRDAVRTVRARRPFHIDAWVVLPDHMHTVWTLPDDDTDYSGRWKAIKIAFAKSLPKTERPGSVASGNTPFVTNRTMWRMSITFTSIL